MAHPTGEITAANLANLIPSVWGSRVNDFFRQELTMAQFFTDRSEEVASGGNYLVTPGIAEMSANSKSAATAVTLNSNTESAVILNINDWKEVSFAIDDQEAAQVKRSYTLQETYAQNAAFTIASELESKIAGLFSGFSSSVGASSTNLADSDIRQAIATLESANVPGIYSGQVAFFLHPNTFWRQVQGIDKYSLAQNAPVQDPVGKKPMASLYGINVFVTSNVPNESGSNGRLNLLAHKDAIHFATAPVGVSSEGATAGSNGVRLQANYIPDHLHTLVTADIIMGAVENRDNAGVLLKSHATSA